MDDQEEKKENLERYFSPVGGFKPGELNIRILPPYKSGKSMLIPSLIASGVLAKPNCLFCDYEASMVTFDCVICKAKTPAANMRNNGFCPACWKQWVQEFTEHQRAVGVLPLEKQRKWRKITEDWEISQES